MDKLKPRLRITPLGDGYVQREADGLNTLRHYFTVSFIGLSEIEKDSLINFVTERAGLEPFFGITPEKNATFKSFVLSGKRTYNTIIGRWFYVLRRILTQYELSRVCQDLSIYP
ncbi:phage tail protein [Piscirickettsia salmonis]|uniref:phage tail protein n=1 Tax=Piscirickettsia salmonis TaxID=1238 RepID=UPI001EE4C7D6|nr:phage tail protein [Piscirickettsia salmonis]